MDSSDVSITTAIGCECSFTKITVDSLTLMDNFDVVRTSTTGCIDFITEVTVEFFSPMDSSDVHIMTATGFEGSGTFTAAMYFFAFLHQYWRAANGVVFYTILTHIVLYSV
jgi:hypothetical protein